MKSFFILLIVAVLLFSCNKSNNPLSDLNKYDYSIDQVRSCFCPNAGKKVKIFVKDNLIADVINTSNKTHLPENEWDQYKTIKGLFDEISLVDTSRFLLEVQYNSQYKYPNLVSIRPKPVEVNDSIIGIIVDGNISYSTSNYQEYK